MNEIEKAQLVQTTVECFRRGAGSLENLPGLLKKVIEERAWEARLHNGRLYELPSLRELVTRKPLEGWGQNPDKIEAVIKDHPEVLALWRDAMSHQGERNDLRNNITEVKATTGTGKAYTVSRLKRESPELFQQVVAGELSANAAAIKAGFRKPVPLLPKDPAKAAQAIRDKMGVDYWNELITK
jgi:hypothetical protein